MTQKKEKFALWITDKAKNCKYDKCKIEGVKDEGQGTQMLKTKIYNFHKKHPTFWKSGFIMLIITIVSGIVILVIEYNIFK